MPKTKGKPHYSLAKKMQTVWLLRDHNRQQASALSGVPVSTIRKWEKDYAELEQQYYQYLNDEVVHRVLVAQHQLVMKVEQLIAALDETRIQKAPLNQISSAIGTLIDRYLKIQDAKDIETQSNHPFRIEYYDASTGTLRTTPPWAECDSQPDEPLRRGIMRQTFWQDSFSQNGHQRSGAARGADMVAGTDVSDGESCLARPETDDEERNWYHD